MSLFCHGKMLDIYLEDWKQLLKKNKKRDEEIKEPCRVCH